MLRLVMGLFRLLDRRVNFCLLARLAGTPKLGLAPSPTRCELATPPSLLVEYIETERWPLPRAFLERFFEGFSRFLVYEH